MDGEGLRVRMAWEEGATLSEVGVSSSVAAESSRAGGDAEGKRNDNMALSQIPHSRPTIPQLHMYALHETLNCIIRLSHPELMVARLV